MVVVHGDDFTAVGAKADILWYEAQLETKFEIKKRGHIGFSDGCVREMRILNRIVRLSDDGLRYEADPRHAEMMIKAMDLSSANPVLTPGVKVPSEDVNIDAEIIHEDHIGDYRPESEESDVAAVTQKPRVTFSDNDPEVMLVTPYSEVYGVHPRSIVATANGWKLVSGGADPYTGKSNRIYHKRAAKVMRKSRMESIAECRTAMINAVFSHGCAWETSTTDEPPTLIGAVRTPSSRPKFQKRQGARAVKKVEMAGNADDLLSGEQATTFRALSARGNYLSQDRVDTSYSTKELCREFAAPANSSFTKLKRISRFLVGAPRLVYEYKWSHDEPGDTIVALVDTDFAGCRATRRSTSGGVLMRGGHCIRHWSTTQTTVALSSGEAELTGICKGAATAIGLCAVARDLGIKLKIVLKSDATAALGMSRRLGIGKVRHLDTSLLWIQQKVRDGEVDVQKILGSDNPADVLTKYVDAATMQKHLRTLGLVYESGRAASAPELAKDK